MAKFTFNDLMTKISNVFKSDLYILNNKYCIGGAESEDKNITQIVCILTPDCSELIKETFQESDVIYIKDVKKVKDNIEEFSSLKIFDSEKKDLIKQRDKVLDFALKVDNWKSFEFSDEDIESIFSDGKAYELFTENDKIPSVTVSKSLFPMVKEKVANFLYYQIYIPENEDDLIHLITSFDTEWFQIYNLIQYIKTE